VSTGAPWLGNAPQSSENVFDLDGRGSCDILASFEIGARSLIFLDVHDCRSVEGIDHDDRWLNAARPTIGARERRRR